MPAPANVAEFIDVVRRSGIVPDDRLQPALTKLKGDPTPPQNVDQIAAALIKDGVLTKFQAKQMKLGRYKRFEIAGKYRLLELLGIGGMGAVYLCEHQFMKRLVALKVLPVEKMEDPSALARFYREARAVAAMDHPNIVRAYDIDKYEQLHFLVMEYVDGTSVQEIVAKHGPIDPLRAAHYAAQSAYGLQHAHELALVHRDIKPGNLLLERTGVVKILDMGLARFFDQKNDNLTEKFDNNCVLGTADYLAPEQAVSNVVDIRADIYALGGSMYFMLTGQSPFPDGTIASKLMAHQTKEPKPVTEFRKDVPPELMAVLHTMMRKNPNERYQTPAEVVEALAPWTSQEIPLPPAHEMPDLCPAVLALTGHQMDKTGKSSGTVTAKTQQRAVGITAPKSRSSLPQSGTAVGTRPPAAAAVRQSEVPTARSATTTPLGTPSPNRPVSNPLSDVTEPDDSSSEVVFNPLAVTKGKTTGGIKDRPVWVLAAAGVAAAVLLLGAGAGLALLVTR
jgi:eukaryotic-like serine/threonine-protein kinase